MHNPVELRLRRGPFETARMDGFFGAIRDAMPDSWGQRVIERHAGVAKLEGFDYLLQGPDDRAGALGFGLNVDGRPVPRNANAWRRECRVVRLRAKLPGTG